MYGSLHLLTLNDGPLAAFEPRLADALTVPSFVERSVATASTPLSGMDAAADSFYRWICPYIRTCRAEVAVTAVSTNRILVSPPASAPTFDSATTTVTTPLYSAIPPQQTFINQPVIERIIEYRTAPAGQSAIVQAALAQSALEESIAALRTELLGVIAQSMPRAFTFSGPAPSTPVSFQSFALSQKIDQLSGTALSNVTVNGISGLTDADIPDTITATNYLPLSGGTVTGDVALMGNFTLAGTQTLSGALTVPYIVGTSSIASSFLQASTTRFSVFDRAYFGGTSTTTIDGAGSITLSAPALLTAPYASSTAISIAGAAYFPGSGIWNASGNVGIGTTGPAAKLDVYGSGSETIRISSSNPGYFTTITNSVSTSVGLVISNADGYNVLTHGQGTGTKLNFQNGTFDVQYRSASKLTVNSSGNVGIGTTTPWGRLSVTGAGTGTGLAFVVADSANTPRFSVLDNGNVGIGTTTPNQPLTVRASGAGQFLTGEGSHNTFAGAFRSLNYSALNHAGVSGGAVIMAMGGGTASVSGWPADNIGIIETQSQGGLSIGAFGAGNIYFQTGSRLSRMTISSTGNIGIGTTNPSSFKLEVAGNVGPSANTTYNLGSTALRWGCVWTSDGSSGTCASDQSLKENIETLQFGDALGKLAALQPRSFSFKSDPAHTHTLGLIAQEVELVAPELVTEIEHTADGATTTVKAVRYGQLQWLMMAALQQLHARIEALGHTLTGLADNFLSQEIVATNRLTTKGELCIGLTCINEAQLIQILNQQQATGMGGSAPPPSQSFDASDEPTPEIPTDIAAN